MTFEEAKKAIDGFKEDGRTDEEIVATFYLMFQDDKLNVKELGDLVGLVGYELTEEFLNMSPEDQKTKVFEDDNEGDNEGEPSLEESDKEPKDNEEPKEENTDKKEPTKEEKPEEKIESDDTQEEKALKLFGLK